MSAICPSCGASLPDGGGACAACGTAAPDGNTVVEPLPVEETGPTPVHFTAVQPRWFGVAPVAALLGLAAAALVVAILLFVFGHWPVGLVLVGLALLFLAAFGEAAKRRRPESPLARRSFNAIRAARERAGFAVGSAAARTRSQRELSRVRHELLGVEQLRQAKVTELGVAVLAEDDDQSARLKEEIGGLDQLAVEKEAEMEAIVARTREGIESARVAVQQTQMLELPDDPNDPETGPAEPPPEYPPPDEGNPPDPARIPEPYPPPEITPPGSER